VTVTYQGRLEARLAVPTGGAAVSATNSGGGPTTVTVPAGNYYPSSTQGSSSSLVSAFQTQLNTSRDPNPGTWSVSLSTTTGLVTIDCTSGEKLTRSAATAWDAGACSSTTIAGDGYVEFTVPATGAYRALGFSAVGAVSINFVTIDYGIDLKGGGTPTEYAVIENGTEILTSAYAVDDKFTVKRTGTTITYYKNGTLIYTSIVASTGALMIDSAFFDASSSIAGIRLYDNGTRVAITWGTKTNVTSSTVTWSLSWTSTDLRDALGFAANISAVTAPQTGTYAPQGVWLPDCPLALASHPTQAPRVTDLRQSESPTGIVLGLAGNSKYRHRGLSWGAVPPAQVWESLATYTNSSWENFLKVTQFGMGHSWFTPSSRVQVYYDNAGTATALGSAFNSNAGVTGWFIKGVTSCEPSQLVQNWNGLFKIEIPELVSDG
jgi:hypothetical protein